MLRACHMGLAEWSFRVSEDMAVDDAAESGDDALSVAGGEAHGVMMGQRRAYKARLLELFGYVSEWDSE